MGCAFITPPSTHLSYTFTTHVMSTMKRRAYLFVGPITVVALGCLGIAVLSESRHANAQGADSRPTTLILTTERRTVQVGDTVHFTLQLVDNNHRPANAVR